MWGEYVFYVFRREYFYGFIGVFGGFGVELGVLLFCFYFILGLEERN